tara:strand:- start:342 stop:518 length:177 start_codon:yes stop_codon:yes gene_type:complete
MEIIQIICLVILLGLCAWRSYEIGIREGASRTVDKLHEAKIICYDNKGNIKPNPFFDA